MFVCDFLVFFFKQKTAYEMRISDWSSDVCSSDLIRFQSRKTCDAVLIGERSIKPFPVLGRYKRGNLLQHLILERATGRGDQRRQRLFLRRRNPVRDEPAKKTVHHPRSRSEGHTSELPSLMRISYAVLILKKQTTTRNHLNIKTQ